MAVVSADFFQEANPELLILQQRVKFEVTGKGCQEKVQTMLAGLFLWA
jgi:hypothetical protein